MLITFCSTGTNGINGAKGRDGEIGLPGVAGGSVRQRLSLINTILSNPTLYFFILTLWHCANNNLSSQGDKGLKGAAGINGINGAAGDNVSHTALLAGHC